MEEEVLSKMLSHIDLAKFREEYIQFRNSQDYERRKLQTRFVTFAQRIILELLKKESISNDDLTSLIHIFNAHVSENILERYIKLLHFEEKIEKELLELYQEIKQNGYTGVGKAAITSLTKEQLNRVKELLIKISESKTLEDIITLCNQFKEENIPEVKLGIYSPWLHYLKPKYCPIIAGNVTKFLKSIEWDGNYESAIIFFNRLKEEVNEDDLGLIDAYFWDSGRANRILKKLNSQIKDPIQILLEKKKQIILYGPPGTGKTFITKKIAVTLIRHRGN